MWVRISTYEAQAAPSRERSLEDAERARSQFLPQMRAMDGFNRVMVAYDPESGRSLSLTFWESEEAMRSSEEAADQIRKESAEQAGDTIVDVRRYEIVLDETR